MISHLVAKFQESRPSQPLTADAPTIFAMWSFAVEHWTQALQQSSSPVNLGNLTSSSDTLRQIIAQALARSEIPEEYVTYVTYVTRTLDSTLHARWLQGARPIGDPGVRHIRYVRYMRYTRCYRRSPDRRSRRRWRTRS